MLFKYYDTGVDVGFSERGANHSCGSLKFYEVQKYH